MGLELAKAYVSVEADASGFPRSVDGIKGTVNRSIGGLGSAASMAIGSLAAGLVSATVGSISGLISSSVAEAAEGAMSSARLAAVLKATGNAAGFTAQQLENYAGSLQESTTFGDEAIKDSMSKLATFKSVSGNMFKRATEAALDMSAVGFGSAEGAAVQLGKALENPIKGVSALARSGVTFSEAEKLKIKTLVESNRLLEAQEVVMKAVEGQVQGVARAMAQTPAGQLEVLNNQFGELKEQLGNQLLPIIVTFKIEALKLVKATYEWAEALIQVGKAIYDMPKLSYQMFWKGIERDVAASLDAYEDAGISFDKLFSRPATVGLSDAAAARVASGALSNTGRDYLNKRKPGAKSENLKRVESELSSMADKFAKRFAELAKGMDASAKMPELPGGMFGNQADEEAAAGGPAAMRPGFMDLVAFGRSIQESLLGDDKQAKMVGLLEAGNKIQEGIRADLKATRGGGGQVALLGGGTG